MENQETKEEKSQAIARDCLLRNIQELNGDSEFSETFTTPDYANQIKIIGALYHIGDVTSARKAMCDMYFSLMEMQPNYIPWYIECLLKFNFEPFSFAESNHVFDEFNRLLFNLQMCKMDVHVIDARVVYNEDDAGIMHIHYCASECRKLPNPFTFDATASFPDMMSFVSGLELESTDNTCDFGEHVEKTRKFKYHVEDLSNIEIAEIYLNNGGKTIIKELL